ncbi:hypothetical protein POM88_051651 [Heracleum sosnowskyi]|uniref:Uncharacterized protein n=1 Tax=Heracleum sosnowskyi TaxID=360622 RepID=A0AAD8M1G7_9APIA|nr:hypothetical protein POM88_051651 [Heracleum sosnowskyi]
MLANVYSTLHPLVDLLMNFVRDGSLLFFQVAVLDKERVLRRKLNKIAENADTSTSDGLNYVFKEAVKALLQYDDSSIHFTRLYTRHGTIKNLSKNFKFLNRELERHGKDENTFEKLDDNVEHKNTASSTENEYTVVSLLVLAIG